MKKTISTVFGFILLAGLGYGGYLLIICLAKSFTRINPSVGAAIIAGATTIISSVYIASLNARKAKERVAFEAHREKKAEVYNEFLDMVIELMRNTKEGKRGDDILPENIEEFFYKFTSKILIYGGPGVVKAFSNWRSAAADEDPIKGLLLIDKLFMEMRADLGESNKGIKKNELLGLFIIGGKSEIAKEANKVLQPTAKRRG
ncbi:hypothetical protein [Desulfonauticus submarinus]|uniref:hypothetical protein n=1 Tax=Desulfonauticus submarinus TaxID=206665 RepID=UPI000B85AE47|nr:hypothetical protein [Desulfonauticus submarinus]